MKIIHFLYNKLIDNGISKLTALGYCPLLSHPIPELVRIIQNAEYTRSLNMPLLGVIQKPEYTRVLNMPQVLDIREC